MSPSENPEVGRRRQLPPRRDYFIVPPPHGLSSYEVEYMAESAREQPYLIVPDCPTLITVPYAGFAALNTTVRAGQVFVGKVTTSGAVWIATDPQPAQSRVRAGEYLLTDSTQGQADERRRRRRFGGLHFRLWRQRQQ